MAGLSKADRFFEKGICAALALGGFGEAGWNLHVVESVLKSGVDEDATAYAEHMSFAGDLNSAPDALTSTDANGLQVTLLT